PLQRPSAGPSGQLAGSHRSLRSDTPEATADLADPAAPTASTNPPDCPAPPVTLAERPRLRILPRPSPAHARRAWMVPAGSAAAVVVVLAEGRLGPRDPNTHDPSSW